MDFFQLRLPEELHIIQEPEPKGLEVGMKPHLARLSPSASSMHLLLVFPEMMLSQVRNPVGITKRSNGSRKHRISLQPQLFCTHLPPCC